MMAASSAETIRLEATLVMRITALIGTPLEIGQTFQGETRVIPITGGAAEGPGISARILPGGADWNSFVEGGLNHFHARYNLLTDDGKCITVINEGLVDADLSRSFIKTRPVFLADRSSKYASLLSGVFVGSLDIAEITDGKVKIEIFRLH